MNMLLLTLAMTERGWSLIAQQPKCEYDRHSHPVGMAQLQMPDHIVRKTPDDRI